MSDSNGDVSISLSVAWHAFPPTCANGGVYYPAFTLQVCNKDLSCLRLSVGHHGTFRVPTRQIIRWLPLRLHPLHHHNYSRYGMASYARALFLVRIPAARKLFRLTAANAKPEWILPMHPLPQIYWRPHAPRLHLPQLLY